MTWVAIALIVGIAQEPAPIGPESAAADSRLVMLQQAGLARKEAARRRAEAPISPAAFRALMQQDHVDEALDVLRTLVETRPEQIADAVQAIGASRRMSDGAFDYAPRLRPIFALARTQAARLPREAAAATEYELLKAEGHFERGQPQEWRSREAAFIQRHPGTRAAAMAEIAQASYASRAQRFEALDAVARRHPGSEIAARVLYEKAFYIAVNWGVTGPARQPDPTERFFDVLAMARELESGRYPASEWVERAPSLVFQFNTYKPEYAPGNVDKMIDAYAAFIRSHFVVDAANPVTNGVGYVIVAKMGELFALKQDEGGVERFLAALEQESSDPAAARYLRAAYLLRRDERLTESARSAGRQRAIALLTAQARDGEGLYARKALATLASLDAEDGRYASAVTRHREYLARYPGSAYAWVAALRLGEAQSALGRHADAVDTHTGATRAYASNSLALSLARAMAGRAHEALGQPDRAVELYAQLVEGWDDDYGPDYSLTYPPGGMRIEKLPAIARVAELRASLSQPGGTLLERGRYRLASHDPAGAEAPLKELSARFPRSPLAPAGALLLHRAQLESALMLADAERGTDPARGRAALDALSKQPFDAAVAAARIAHASIAWTDGRADAARTGMNAALTDWLKNQVLSAPRTDLERDVAAIREAVVRPLGGGIYTTASRWDSFSWPSAPPPFFLVNAEVNVTLSNGAASVVALAAPLPGAPYAVFVTADQLALLNRIMAALGGTKRRQPEHIMEVPNQPAGDSMRILALWKEFFPCQPGHWGGWELVGYPRLTRIEFLDAARTKASAAITIGYSGASVVMEKIDGTWKPIRLTNFWIT